MGGPVGPTVAADTATGAGMAMVVQETGIAPAGPIGAVRLVGMPEAATAAMLEAGSVATSVVDSMAAVAAFMVAVAMEADTANS